MGRTSQLVVSTCNSQMLPRGQSPSVSHSWRGQEWQPAKSSHNTHQPGLTFLSCFRRAFWGSMVRNGFAATRRPVRAVTVYDGMPERLRVTELVRELMVEVAERLDSQEEDVFLAGRYARSRFGLTVSSFASVPPSSRTVIMPGPTATTVPDARSAPGRSPATLSPKTSSSIFCPTSKNDVLTAFSFRPPEAPRSVLTGADRNTDAADWRILFIIASDIESGRPAAPPDRVERGSLEGGRINALEGKR
jgi:hypothetical protein